MLLAAGRRLEPYEIVGPLGAGGIGEVYRASDTRLGREVAVKVLAEAVSRFTLGNGADEGVTMGPLIPFRTEDEAIAMANDTEFGLSAYFCARDVGRIWRVAEGIECGIIGINGGVISNTMAPFGGMKASGNGREGSKYGLDDYLEIKSLCIGGIGR